MPDTKIFHDVISLLESLEEFRDDNVMNGVNVVDGKGTVLTEVTYDPEQNQIIFR